VALSINIARVGDTTIVSNATTPDVPFWTKCHPWLARTAATTPAKESERKSRESHMSGFISRATDGCVASNSRLNISLNLYGVSPLKPRYILSKSDE
jgi:hypothetical protein